MDTKTYNKMIKENVTKTFKKSNDKIVEKLCQQE